MSMDEFRINHSKLIEQYQLIEHHLEGLFAICGSGDFEELAHRVENDTMGELIRKVRFITKEKHIDVLDKNDFAILDEIRDSRNYWCHQCYLDIREDNSRNYVSQLTNDLDITISMNEKLRKAFQIVKEQ